MGDTVTVGLFSGAVGDVAGNQNAALAATSVFNTVVTLPGKPTGLTVGTVTPTKIPLSWTAPTNAGGYSVERAPDVSGSAGTWAAVWSGNVTSYTDTALTPGTKYHYRVSGINSGGTGAASDSVSGTTAALPVVTITAQNATVTEGSRATFIISRTGNDGDPISVFVALTATGDMGIATGNRTFNLPAGTSLASYNANSTGDAVDEENGSVTARLRTATDGVTINGYTIGTPASTTVTVEDDDTVPGTPVVSAQGLDTKLVLNWPMPAEGTSSITGYDYRYKTTAGAEATWSTWTDTGLSGSDASHDFEITGLTNGTDYTVEVRAESLAGYSIAGSANATPTPPPMITSVAITSDPGTDKTYIIGDALVVTVTFDKNITLTSGSGSAPNISALIGSLGLLVPCHPLTPPTMELVCSVAIEDGDGEDSDGVSLPRNGISTSNRMIVGPLGQIANLDYSRLADDSDHKVDGVKPTVAGAEAMEDSLTIKFSEALDEDSTPATSAFTLNVDSGTAPTISSVDIDGSNVTLSLSAAVDTSKTYTIDYTAPMTSPIKDLAGNAAADVSTQSVSTVDTTAPMVTGAEIMQSASFVSLYLDEAPVSTSTPAAGAFTVKVEGAAQRLHTLVQIVTDPAAIVLALRNAVKPGETVTVSYTKPGSNPLKDAADNETASFTDLSVANNLAAAAPDAPRNLAASAGSVDGAMELTWETPWANGSDITKFQVRYAVGTSVPATTTWDDITGSGASTTSHTVTGLTAGTEYTFEVRAVNGIGNGAEASVTKTVLAPVWEFTLTDSNGNNVTELTEGGDPATATVSITNNVTFGTDQTVQLKWGTTNLEDHVLIEGAGDVGTITIVAGQSSGSLEISAPDIAGDRYDPSFTMALTATHGGTEIGGSIDLTWMDDESVPVASITDAPTTVNEGEDIEFEISLTRGFGSIGANINFTVMDADSALSGTLPTDTRFAQGQATKTITLTADDNSVQNDGTREVTFALALNDDAPYTLDADASSVTVEVRDNDTPPTVPRSLTAQAGDTTARLQWQPPLPPNPDHGQPILHYEYRLQVGTAAFSDWAPIPGGDANTTSHTFTGLTNETVHTYEVRAVNIAGGGGAASTTVTPIAGVAVSFAAASLSVDEGEGVAVTVTLAAAPAVGTTVTVPLTATRGAGLEANEYAGVPASVTFNPGETSKSFTVSTVEDTADELNETLTLAFGTLPAGYIPGTRTELVLTVVDDDHPIVSASFDRAAASVVEGGTVTVTVRLSETREREVVLPLVATRGANLAADEVLNVPASVTIAAGATQARFTVTVADDAVVEGNETLTLTFGTRPAGVTQGQNPQLVLTVTDDDGPPAAPDVSAQTGAGYVALSWAAVANDSPVLRYEVRWRETAGAPFGVGGWQSVNLDTSYRVEGLTNDTAYEFEVRAVNAHGDGEAGSAPGTPTERLTGIPKAVQVLLVKATDSGRAELSWTRPANGTDRVTRNSASATFSQIQGYRIEVCRTTCDDEADWYAVVANTRAFEHKYVHQVLAPGVIRENHYRVQAININGKPGPWSNVATLDETVVENVYLQTPDDSTLWVRFRVLNPDGNLLHVRYDEYRNGFDGQRRALPPDEQGRRQAGSDRPGGG